MESLFRRWLVEHQGTILKVARAYTRTREDCEDLAQEIVLQVWRSLPRFQGRAGAATWCYRVALNTALSWQRRERRRQARQRPILAIERVEAEGVRSDQQSVERETVERLYAAIRHLSKTDAALILLYLDGFSYRQMAEVLGISDTHVGVKLTRAKKALGELLNEESDES